MNLLERRMVDALKDLMENHRVVGIKAEFEAEGTRLEEVLRLAENRGFAGGFNRGLVMRALIGTDSPRGLQDRLPAVAASLASWILVLGGRSTAP